MVFFRSLFPARSFLPALGVVVATQACSSTSLRQSSSEFPSEARGSLDVLEAGSGERAVKDIVVESKPAIVRVEAMVRGEKRVGTGFIVRSDGLVATNLHVIQSSADVRIVLLNGTTARVRNIASYDERYDLAIVRMATTGKLPTLRLGDSNSVAAGDPVIAIGNPLGVLDYSVSDGLISSVRVVNPSLTVLQISAPISRGSSGGPLFNRQGEVIGIATMVSRKGQNLNFGVPSNYLRPLLLRLREEPLEKFFRRQQARAVAGKRTRQRMVRQVPKYDVSALSECQGKSIAVALDVIRRAISLGAPIYNQGGFEVCYRIYEGAALRLERESQCPLVRKALGSGLLRSGTKSSYRAKAWALRDAFDAILNVARRLSSTGRNEIRNDDRKDGVKNDVNRPK